MTVEKKSAKKDVTTSSTLKIEATKSANVNKQNSELFKSQKKSKQETTVIAKNDDKPKDDVKPKDDAKVTENAKPEIDAKSKDIAKPKDDIKLKDGTKTNDDSVLKDDTKLKDDPKVKGAVPVAINSRSYIDNQSENHIEVIPKSTKSNQEEKIAIKRNPVDHPKQSEEPNQHQDPVVKPNIGKPGLKGLKKIIDDTLGEPKPSKPLIPSFKKPQINSCATLTTRRQLHEAGERISNLLGKLEQPHFNCALLNTEIETIKGMLQHVLIHTPADGKRKEVDRTKIIDQIKERQAKIHARFGHREIGKHGRLGMRKGIGREESVEDKSEVADLRGGKREIKTL